MLDLAPPDRAPPDRAPVDRASRRVSLRGSLGPLTSRTVPTSAIALRTFPGLAGVPGLRHGVTTRAGGTSRGPYASLNLGRSSGDDATSVLENRRRAAAALGASTLPRIPRQVHGCAVAVVEDAWPDEWPVGARASIPVLIPVLAGDPAEAPAAEVVVEADAVATALAGVPVGVLGADCPGVLLVDPRRRALALVHSGWRGTLAGAVRAAVEVLRRRFGSDEKDLLAGIGPGISAARYEVGPEVADAFRAGFPGADGCLTRGRGDRSHLDLREAIRLQLLSCGVAPESVEVMEACTYEERDAFFSHRRDGPATGRHALLAVWDA